MDAPEDGTPMKNAYILDTNHVSSAINPISPIRDRLHQAHRQGAKLGTCVPVLCELEVGIQDSPHTESYRRQLAQLFRRAPLAD